MKKIFDVEKFNLIQDDENYYFFRSLEPGDIEDIEKNIITKEKGYIKLRTDRERWEETHEEKPRWNEDSKVSLEEMFNHIKMHYSLQTNCISLSSNANVARTYGESFSDKYVMIRIPKKEMGEKVFHAGEYMLEQIENEVENAIEKLELSEQIQGDLRKIDEAETSDELKEIIQVRYTSKEIDLNKRGMRKGIVYRSPHYRVSNFQALDEEQTLEKNKIVAKLTVLERKANMPTLMKGSSNNNLLIQTLGSAFSSSEQIYYGDIDGDRIIDISKEALDVFGLLQQAESEDKQIVEELKREFLKYVIEGKEVARTDNDNYQIKDNITIDEMYELTEGKVEYGIANNIVKNMFYLAKGQSNARSLAEVLRNITNNNPKYERVIEYIENNGFEIEPKIITRRSNKGYRLSESVNLDLKQSEYDLINQIKSLTDEEQIEILENGGLSNVENIMITKFAKVSSQEKIDKEMYYAEAIFSLYDWNKIGIQEFRQEERNNFLNRLKDNHCLDLYKKIEEQGIEKKDIPTVLLNIITLGKDFEITEEDNEKSIKVKRLEQYDRIFNERNDELNQELSVERIERFLGYYDVGKTDIQLRQYQQRAVEKTDELFETERFASVILPTGGGKSFVAISELMKHKDEEIIYLAPQNEILEQMKDYIIKYVHGPKNTIGRNKDEIIKEVFPNLKFSTYPGLMSKEGKDIINKEYGFVVLDELHRTGAAEWGKNLNALIENQNENTKVLGITATPRRDVDGKDMSIEMAQKLGYTNKEAVNGKHIAINMSLINAIRMGLVVNPKLVSCEYNLIQDGSLDKLREKIDDIENIQQKNEKIKEYETLRRKVEKADGVSKVLQDNVKKGGKYIVFLPVIDNFEDEDGNLIGNKKSKEKVEEYEKQIREYFKDSDIVPRFHSMLGEYGDKENEKRLEGFQNSNSDDVEFMLVINKANEGLHIDGLDGIIWLRALDENSKILYLQQLGRAIYSENPDKPTKEEDRPVIIDLVNNTLKVDWQNIVTQQDDIELLKVVVDWIEKHDGILPDVNSKDMDQIGYAICLKDIQKKYGKYLNEEFVGLNEKQIEEVKEILELGSSIDLWKTELEERKVGETGSKTEKRENDEGIGSFQLKCILGDLVDLEHKVEEISVEDAYEKMIEYLEKNGKAPQSAFRIDNRFKTRGEMTEDERFEARLYGKWKKTKEYKVLNEYEERPIEEVPEEYREKITKLRSFGLGVKKSTYEAMIEYLENNWKWPQSSFSDEGNKKNTKEMTEDELYQTRLYRNWSRTIEYKVLNEYEGRPIEEVPEEYRERIAKLRSYEEKIRGEREKDVYEDAYEAMIEYIEKNEKWPQSIFKIEGKRKSKEEMTEDEWYQNKLYRNWSRTIEYKVFNEYKRRPIEEVPEEYREKIAKLRNYEKKIQGNKTKYKDAYEEIIEYLENNGKMPKTAGKNGKNGKNKKRKEMTEDEKYQANLNVRWRRSNEYKIFTEYKGRPIEEVPEEYREKIAKLRSFGLEKGKINAQEIGQAGFGTDTKVCDEVADAFNKELSKQKTNRDIK